MGACIHGFPLKSRENRAFSFKLTVAVGGGKAGLARRGGTVVEWARQMEREAQMNLDANGRKRLAAMKRALAAGAPLAGLLAGMVCASEAVAGEYRTMGEPMPKRMQEERRLMGDRVMGKVPPRVIEAHQSRDGDEDCGKDPNGAGTQESPEKPGMPDGEGEAAR